jgi:hypothetical protein
VLVGWLVGVQGLLAIWQLIQGLLAAVDDLRQLPRLLLLLLPVVMVMVMVMVMGHWGGLVVSVSLGRL